MTQKRQILLQNALALLCEVQRQAVTLKDETSEEARDLMHRLSHQAKEGVVNLVDYWQKNKTHLPEKITCEVDGLLHKIGLTKKAKQPAKKAPVKKAAVKPTVKSTTKTTTKPAAKPSAKKKVAPKKGPTEKAPTMSLT